MRAVRTRKDLALAVIRSSSLGADAIPDTRSGRAMMMMKIGK